MSESETILVKKKKKEAAESEEDNEDEFDYTGAVKILKPLIKKWSELGEEVARKLHEYYINPKCKFYKLCKMLGVSDDTMYRLFDKHELPRKYGEVSDAALNREISPQVEEEFEELPEEAYAATRHDEIYRILDEAEHLSVKHFNNAEKKEELIEKLQKTIAKLNGLLVRLESNL